ncbi:MAG: glycosyltransferase family 4 protein [Xanthobacteraceae bacterium]
MRILVATDAWQPQVNGVVRTLMMLAKAAEPLGAKVMFLTPQNFRSVPLPTYPDIRLALASARRVSQFIAQAAPDAIHVATEGPIGHAVRHYCQKRGLPFTTSFHTRFPDYVAARLPIPESWVWAWLRRFHRPSANIMAATPGLLSELSARGFSNVTLWPRGVDTNLFAPQRRAPLDLPRPIFLTVGRLAVEKNIESFLSLDLPGSKLVVGDGPLRGELAARFPQATFLGMKHGEELASIYAASDVFVFPSRTDTFGLVLLEALASGVPIAAYPVSGPRDVIGSATNVGVLDWDLRSACLQALTMSPDACRAFALGMTWEASARAFIDNAVKTNTRKIIRKERPLGRLPLPNGARWRQS